MSNSIYTQFTNVIPWSDSLEENSNLITIENKIVSIPIKSVTPIKVMILAIALPDHPKYTDEWPTIKNQTGYPNIDHPILGTFPNGTLLRDSLENNGPISVQEWFKPQIELYYETNSDNKFNVELVIPKTKQGKVYKTKRSYNDWVESNGGNTTNLVMGKGHWKEMATEVMENVYADDQNIFEDIKLINFVFLVRKDEFTAESFGAYSPDIRYLFISSNPEREFYNGYVTILRSFSPILHESFHRIGSMIGEPFGFEGLPDRTTLKFFDAPQNMTWGHDIMYNKGQIVSENALYGVPPMLTIDRIFLQWIDPSEVLTIISNNTTNIKLTDVNIPLSEEQKLNKFYRAVRIMINENFYYDLDEYFLIEFRNGSNYDRNFYNIYETEPHKGILIWHVKENAQLLNRNRTNDHFIDLEIAVPYNGWNGNPIPIDDFPRNYYRPADWYEDINKAGDFDYLDDNSSPPHLPDGGVHRWELTDTSHPEWSPYYLRRNSLRTNFFTDESIRGVVTNRFADDTRPSSKDWEGNPTSIEIFNIKKYDNYMTFDVTFESGVLSSDNNLNGKLEYRLYNNYPNPFNPTTNISFTIPKNGYVKLELLNILGEKVRILVDDWLPAGIHQFEVDSNDLSSGIYFYTLKINGYFDIKKMIVLK
ncbi:T9SS type A sorting domain-containing protein [Bacteroidota bacterium]